MSPWGLRQYAAERLRLLGLLLCSGTFEQKSKVLYEFVTAEDALLCSEPRLSGALTDIVELSCYVIV